MSKENIHGSGGLYCGGEWIDMEDCAELRKNPSADACKGCSSCGRSKTSPSDANSYDVVIVGAGCIGGAVARELSKYTARVLLVEKADDVTQGATKGNSGIVHAGYDDKPGSVKSKYCWAGNQMFAQLDKELHFGYLQNGSLVVARGEEEEKTLEELMERGEKNGVARLRIVRGNELREMEPHLAADCTAALYSPDAGTVTPYEYTIALVENAVDNGVDLLLNTQVVAIDKRNDNSFAVHLNETSPPAAHTASISSVVTSPLNAALLASAVLLLLYALVTGSSSIALFALIDLALVGVFVARAVRQQTALKTETSSSDPNFAQKLKSERETTPPVATRVVNAKYVVNCAGLFSDKIARMVDDDSFTILPRLGEYLLFHKKQGHLAKHVLFPCPGKMGKGVVIQPTLWGNLLLGPTARNLDDKQTLTESNEAIISEIVSKCRRLVPSFDAGEIIHTFAGARAKSTRGDWIVEASRTAPHMIHVAGIDSPGLAGSPALAVAAVGLLRGAGLQLVRNACFEPRRGAIVAPKRGWKGLKVAPTLADADAMPAEKAVVCRCEKVTRAEIEEACRRSLPCNSTQAVRKRTRAGMGHCQGTFCEQTVQALVAREHNVATSSVPRRPWPETSLLPSRWLTDEQKEHYRQLK